LFDLYKRRGYVRGRDRQPHAAERASANDKTEITLWSYDELRDLLQTELRKVTTSFHGRRPGALEF
jgi:hypothetical protein